MPSDCARPASRSIEHVSSIRCAPPRMRQPLQVRAPSGGCCAAYTCGHIIEPWTRRLAPPTACRKSPAKDRARTAGEWVLRPPQDLIGHLIRSLFMLCERRARDAANQPTMEMGLHLRAPGVTSSRPCGHIFAAPPRSRVRSALGILMPQPGLARPSLTYPYPRRPMRASSMAALF